MGEGCPLNVNHEVNSLITIPSPEIQVEESDICLTQAGTSPNNLGNEGRYLLRGHTQSIPQPQPQLSYLQNETAAAQTRVSVPRRGSWSLHNTL